MNSTVAALTVDDIGNLYAGGAFTFAGGVVVNRIARWDGSSWSALGTGMGNGTVSALAVDGSGKLFAGGNFLTAGGLEANRSAHWDGTSWIALGTGMTGQFDTVRALALDGSGNLYAGGNFTIVGDEVSGYIAKWIGHVYTEAKIAVEAPTGTEVANTFGSLEFGEISPGQSIDQSITIRNDGETELSGIVATITGSDAADFELLSIPPISLAGGAGFQFNVRFAPTISGTKTAILSIASDDAANNPFSVNLSGSAASGTSFNEFAADAGLIGDDALPDATPFNDGVANLLKYAFNMNLAGPDNSRMEAGGNSGLPGGGLVEENGETYWRVEFVRRKNSGLIYVPQKSSALEDGSFSPMTGEVSVTDIPGEPDWERVVINEPCDPATEDRCFTRVRVDGLF